MNSVSITAHRKLAKTDIPVIVDTMKTLVENPDVEVIWFGGATGGDTIALRAALNFRKDKRPELVVVVPDTLASQPKAVQAYIQLADRVVELRHPVKKEDGFKAYKIRDQYLVDRATSLVAFYSGRRNSGTGLTIAMALKAKVPVQIVTIASGE